MNTYSTSWRLPFIMLALIANNTCGQTSNGLSKSAFLISSPQRLSLNGEYAFAADYADSGERFEWFLPTYDDNIWDRVNVPHVWSLDPRYPYYEGTAWYRKSFMVPNEFKTKHLRLVFEAIYHTSVVWLNGNQLALHNGGYTPFEIDVTPYLRFDRPNLLVIKANNSIAKKANAIPQLVRAWMEDGGVIRDVYLEANAKVFVSNQKIDARPDLSTGEASVQICSWVRNVQDRAVTVRVRSRLYKEKELLKINDPGVKVTIAPNSNKQVYTKVRLPKEMVQLWGLDSPVLYNSVTTIDGMEAADPVHFGIRTFEVRGTELLLNGYPVRLAGANRVPDGTGFGQNDPVEFVEKDLRLMKEAGLEFMRMHHVPLSKAVLDWADRNGMLLIEECATPTNLFSDSASAFDRVNMKEMIERDWNRPSIVAWSIGNEYESETPDGVNWSRQMKAFVLSIDSTRLICFASNRAAKLGLLPGDEASSLMDFVCLNTYGATPDDNAANIDRVHQRWPDKPLIITEYGYRADRVGQEKDRELWFSEMFAVFRKRPFISGASVWSFNDYRSRYISTNPDGYRWWGLVDADRNLRGSYLLFKRELIPFIVKEAKMVSNNVLVRLAASTGFPVYPPTGCKIKIQFYNFRGRKIDVQEKSVDSLMPGQELNVEFSMKAGVTYFKGEILRNKFLIQAFGPTTWSNK